MGEKDDGGHGGTPESGQAVAKKPATTGLLSTIVAGVKGVLGSGSKAKTQPASKPAASKAGAAASTAPKPESEAIPLAVDIGWTMALLFGELAPALIQGRQNAKPVQDKPERLPTEHELSAQDRTDLELKRLSSLLTRLGKLFAAGLSADSEVPDILVTGKKKEPLTAANLTIEPLTDANLAILKWLACAGREYGIAYQLGRSLRTTAAPPLRAGAPQDTTAQNAKVARVKQLKKAQQAVKAAQDKPKTPEDQATEELAAYYALLTQLSRPRVSTLQEWLSTLTPYLPTDSAAIVSASIGRWSDLITTMFVTGTPGKLRWFSGTTKLAVAAELTGGLLPQGDAWINLLVGAESSDGLLTPEGLVAAGEAALGRTARIVKRIAVHYWFVLLVLAAAVAAAVYFAASDLNGASRIWTQIAAVAGGLGITAKSASNTLTTLTKDAEKPIFGAEKIDAMAWAVTTIPADLKVSARGVHALRRSGIPRSGPMGRS
jgi:hypothetical protein